MKTSYPDQQLQDPLTAEVEAFLRKCVHCGLCTATCSSYVILGDERASPRGRLYLINKMMETGGEPSKTTTTYLDNCLTCLSCMTTCPSGVDYVHVVDMARARINKKAKRPLTAKLSRSALVRLLPYPGRMKLAMTLGRLARPLEPLIRKLKIPLAAQMLAALPTRNGSAPRLLERNPASGKRRARVAMLAGCSNDLMRSSINKATLSLLTRMGVEVIVPSGLGCCGALEHHLGHEDKAIASAKRNVDVLSKLHDKEPLDAIITAASGCGSTLKDYAHLLRHEEGHAKRAEDMAKLALDITELLAKIPMLAPAQWAGIKVAYHASCSLEHGQKVVKQPRELLQKAGYIVLEVPEGHICCGSAGTYSLLQPEISTALKNRKLKNIAKTAPDVIAAGNIGCINHLEKEAEAPIVHTVELLDWAYGGDCPAELRHLEAQVNKVSGLMKETLMEDLKPKRPQRERDGDADVTIKQGRR